MSLSGPSRTIVVEPIERPVRAPAPPERDAPAPAKPPAVPEREPGRVGAAS
jgi:hypothetical protein